MKTSLPGKQSSARSCGGGTAPICSATMMGTFCSGAPRSPEETSHLITNLEGKGVFACASV